MPCRARSERQLQAAAIGLVAHVATFEGRVGRQRQRRIAGAVGEARRHFAPVAVLVRDRERRAQRSAAGEARQEHVRAVLEIVDVIGRGERAQALRIAVELQAGAGLDAAIAVLRRGERRAGAGFRGRREVDAVGAHRDARAEAQRLAAGIVGRADFARQRQRVVASAQVEGGAQERAGAAGARLIDARAGLHVERWAERATDAAVQRALDQLAARGLAGVRLAVDLGVGEAEAQHAGVVDLRLDPRRDVEAVEPVTPGLRHRTRHRCAGPVEIATRQVDRGVFRQDVFLQRRRRRVADHRGLARHRDLVGGEFHRLADHRDRTALERLGRHRRDALAIEARHIVGRDGADRALGRLGARRQAFQRRLDRRCRLEVEAAVDAEQRIVRGRPVAIEQAGIGHLHRRVGDDAGVRARRDARGDRGRAIAEQRVQDRAERRGVAERAGDAVAGGQNRIAVAEARIACGRPQRHRAAAQHRAVGGDQVRRAGQADVDQILAARREGGGARDGEHADRADVARRDDAAARCGQRGEAAGAADGAASGRGQRRAGQRAVDGQRALFDTGRAAVAVAARQDQLTPAALGEAADVSGEARQHFGRIAVARVLDVVAPDVDAARRHIDLARLAQGGGAGQRDVHLRRAPARLQVDARCVEILRARDEDVGDEAGVVVREAAHQHGREARHVGRRHRRAGQHAIARAGDGQVLLHVGLQLRIGLGQHELREIDAEDVGVGRDDAGDAAGVAVGIGAGEARAIGERDADRLLREEGALRIQVELRAGLLRGELAVEIAVEDVDPGVDRRILQRAQRRGAVDRRIHGARVFGLDPGAIERRDVEGRDDLAARRGDAPGRGLAAQAGAGIGIAAGLVIDHRQPVRTQAQVVERRHRVEAGMCARVVTGREDDEHVVLEDGVVEAVEGLREGRPRLRQRQRVGRRGADAPAVVDDAHLAGVGEVDDVLARCRDRRRSVDTDVARPQEVAGREVDRRGQDVGAIGVAEHHAVGGAVARNGAGDVRAMVAPGRTRIDLAVVAIAGRGRGAQAGDLAGAGEGGMAEQHAAIVDADRLPGAVEAQDIGIFHAHEGLRIIDLELRVVAPRGERGVIVGRARAVGHIIAARRRRRRSAGLRGGRQRGEHRPQSQRGQRQTQRRTIRLHGHVDSPGSDAAASVLCR